MKLLSIIIVSFAFGLSACSPEKAEMGIKHPENIPYGTGVITIDSCQYVTFQMGNGNVMITHKGNCKYCKLRNK